VQLSLSFALSFAIFFLRSLTAPNTELGPAAQGLSLLFAPTVFITSLFCYGPTTRAEPARFSGLLRRRLVWCDPEGMVPQHVSDMCNKGPQVCTATCGQATVFKTEGLCQPVDWDCRVRGTLSPCSNPETAVHACGAGSCDGQLVTRARTTGCYSSLPYHTHMGSSTNHLRARTNTQTGST
jgi:hypothetical protein